MPELLQEAIGIHNLPVTVLLGIMLVYWLLVILGAADADLDAPDLDSEASHGSDNAGLWHSFHRLLHLGEVPLMIVLSVLALFMWIFSVTANYIFNGAPGDRSATIALLYLVPNFFVSLLLTRIVLSPLSGLIRKMQTTETEGEEIIGREAVVISTEVTDQYGQIEISTKGAPLTVNARVAEGRPSIRKGLEVLVFEAGPDDAYYYIRPLQPNSD